jgi:hypothetical protein
VGPPGSLRKNAVANSVMCDRSRPGLFQNGHRTRLPLTAMLNIATIRYPFGLLPDIFAARAESPIPRFPIQDASNSQSLILYRSAQIAPDAEVCARVCNWLTKILGAKPEIVRYDALEFRGHGTARAPRQIRIKESNGTWVQRRRRSEC